MEKLDFLFKFVDYQIRSKILLDEEALYSTTDQITADKITTDILSFVPRTSTITDATACAGGNTYSFAQHFDHVYAFELDHMRVRILQHNMKLLGARNVVVRHGDSSSLCRQQYQDVIFLDPPWGGPNYKKHAKIVLYLSDKHIADFCNDIAIEKKARYIALKAPTNFDEVDFLDRTSTYMKLVHKNNRLRKMFLYIFELFIDV
jgi:tRNA/tmRNA/rRNA uracil-C5-methylase (TrmA/RlmC/RlmD family)